MIYIRKVRGSSMRPALVEGDVVVAVRRRLTPGAIVIAKQEATEIIKRAVRIDSGGVYLVGDNSHDSTDSRHYGKINESAILGSIMIVFPRPVDPPALTHAYGLWFGRAAAAILAVMSLVHLFRIDTLIPIMDSYIPGGAIAASIFVGLVICSELFAIPFALRIKLSPLAQLLSGALVVFAPLSWVLIGIWTLGLSVNTGQLGEFVFVTSTAVTLLLNILWLGYNYYALYTLGFNRLSIADVLRK